MKRKMILQLLVVSVIVTGCGKSESSKVAAPSDEAISSNVAVSDETTAGGEVSIVNQAGSRAKPNRQYK